MAQPNGGGCLYECLQEAHLERYHAHFVRYGITKCEGLAGLSMQDYSRFGITRMDDRVRLFKLVQIVKSVQSEGKYCKHDNRYVPLEHPQQFQQQRLAQYGNEEQRVQDINKSKGQAFLQYVRSRPTVRPMDQGAAYNVPARPQGGMSIATESVMAPAKKKPRTDSEVGVRYRPGTGSPIFNCRKTLTFSDSEDDCDEEVEIDEVQTPDTNSITDSEIRLKVLSTITSGMQQGQEQAQVLGSSVKVSTEPARISYDQHSHKPIRVVVPPPKSFYINFEDKASQPRKSPKENNIIMRSSRDNLFGHPCNRVTMAPPSAPLNQNEFEKNLNSNERTVNSNQRKRIMQQETEDYGNISAELLAKKTTAQSKSKNQEFKVNHESEEEDDKETDEYFSLPVPAGLSADRSMDTPPRQTSDAKTQTPPDDAASLHTQPLKAIILGVQTQSVEIKPSQPFKKSKAPEYNPANYSPKAKKVMSRIKAPTPIQYGEIKTHFREGESTRSSTTMSVPVTAHIAESKTLPKSAIMREARQRAMAEAPVHAYFPNTQTPSSPMREPVIERVVHAKDYNYGVPCKQDTPSKNRASSSRRGSNQNQRIRVCVRKRPLTRREQKRQEVDIASVDGTDTIIVDETKVAVDLAKYIQQHVFVFDEVFNESHTNIDVYASTAKPLVKHIFNKGCATCFAFGQTGAGKTYTLLGTQAMPGLYRLAAADMFSYLQGGDYGHDLHLWVSYYEIYCSQLYDLLNKRKRLHVRENGRQRVCIAGLMETRVRNVDDVAQVVQYGNAVRSTGSTGVNPNSSRSHAILQLEIRDSKDQRLGRLSFIDLAGSERAADVTEFDRQTRIEGAEINQSLLALKECIRSLDQDSKHTPYRQSKLTHILRDSFVGNSRTCMIANISPSLSACENSLNTLRYADRVKELRANTNLAMTTPSSSSETPSARLFNPSVFHPSNIQFSSTPKQEDGGNPASTDMDFQEGYDSPIRGHKIRKPGDMKTITPQKPTRDSASPRKKSPGFEFTFERQGSVVNIATSKGAEPRSRDSSLENLKRSRSGSTGSFHSSGKLGSSRKQSPGSTRGTSSTPRSTPRSGRRKLPDGSIRSALQQTSPQNNENSHSGGERRSGLHSKGRHLGSHTNDGSPHMPYQSSPKVPSIKGKLMSLGDSDTFESHHWSTKGGSRSAREALASSSGRSSNDHQKGHRTRATFIEDHRQILSHLDNIMDRAKAAIEKSTSSDEQSPQRPYSARTTKTNIEFPSPERPSSADQRVHTRSRSLPNKATVGERHAPIMAASRSDDKARYEEGIALRSKLYDLQSQDEQAASAKTNNITGLKPETFRPLEEDTQSLEEAKMEEQRIYNQDSHMPDGHHFSPQREEVEEEQNQGKHERSLSLELHSELDTTLSEDESEEEDTTVESDDLDTQANEGEEYCLCETTQDSQEGEKKLTTAQRQIPDANNETEKMEISSGKSTILDRKSPSASPTENRLNPRRDAVTDTAGSTDTSPHTSLHHSNHDISKHVANIRSLLSVDSSERLAESCSSNVSVGEKTSEQIASNFVVYNRSVSMPERQDDRNQPVLAQTSNTHSSEFLQSLADIKIGRPVLTTSPKDDQQARLQLVNPALARLSQTFKTPESQALTSLRETSEESRTRPFQPYHRATVPQEAPSAPVQSTKASKASASGSSETLVRDITDSGIDTQTSMKLQSQEEEIEPVSTASTLDGIVSLSNQQEDDTRWEAIRTHHKKLEQVVRQQSRQRLFDSGAVSGRKQSPENAMFTPIHPYPATHLDGHILAPISVHRRGSREDNASENSEELLLNSVAMSCREERVLAGAVSLSDIKRNPNQTKPNDDINPVSGLNEESGTPRSTASTSSTKSNGSAIMRAQVAVNENQNHIRQLVLAAHEEQLAEITALCKQEMKLLVAVKSGEKTFDEYVQHMELLLSSKAATIATLRSQVAEFVSHPVRLSASNTPR